MNKLFLPSEPRILADSTNWTKSRLTSFLFPLPTCLLAELRTHRLLKYSFTENTAIDHSLDFSVNANSDRAIPISKKIESIEKYPYIPIVTSHNKGMTAIEDVPFEQQEKILEVYLKTMNYSISKAKELMILGASKQFVNRLLMPYSWSFVVVTGDGIAWESFFNLRTNKDVEPNFRYIALKLQELYNNSEPTFLTPNDWHISFREEIKELESSNNTILTTKQDLIVSASCCARISYDINRNETLEKHIDRFEKCINSNHISIAEHQAKVPTRTENSLSILKSNVDGWILYRKILENNRNIF